jgi:N-acyl-D-amino-acid deacylase
LVQKFFKFLLLFSVPLLLAARSLPGDKAPQYDVLIRGGTVYDGTGGTPWRMDLAIRGDRIAALGRLDGASARTVIDARGLAVAPGFINMLSWSTVSLLVDGRSQSEIHQGVTTEIMGEGQSMGPLTDDMKRRMLAARGDLKFDIRWATLAQYLAYLETRGVSPNVASFIGSGTIREYVLGQQNVRPTPVQMKQMCELVRREMQSGALGIGSALLYPPGSYADTEELIALCRVAAAYGGMYISHVRNEGGNLIEAVEELIRISREAGIPAEIYHLKAGGISNWDKMDRVVSIINEARRRGIPITADMYLYPASSNRLASRIPAWAREGGDHALLARLKNPSTRQKIADQLRSAGPMPTKLLIGFHSDDLKPLTGKSLEEIARMRGKGQVDTMLDLVLADHAAPRVVTFSMCEENILKGLRQPWVSLGSDAASIAAEGVFLKSSTHPRAYGNFARLFGKYVRDEKAISMAEAVRRVTGLPASNLHLDRRGFLKQGYFADVVVFDPQEFRDTATYEDPHRYAAGMKQVFVNGVQVLKDGQHTGATPGRALWGRGRTNP